MLHSVVEPSLHAVLVTYQRPSELLLCIQSLAAQSHQVASLMIVDNDGSASPSVANLQPEVPFEVEVLAPGDNLGPAGGFAYGINALLDRVSPNDWVLLLDDDDPLPSERMLAALLQRRDALLASGVRLGGIGAKGARFDIERARTRPIPDVASDVYEVDHLHGGYAPIYLLSALQAAGNFRPELFWGREELDIGLRLNDAGWRLFVDVDVLRSLPSTSKLASAHASPRFLVRDESFERRYYAIRNLEFIARERSSSVRLRAALALRELGKPAANLVVRPRLALSLMKWNLRARRDARQGRLGRTVPL